MCHIKQNHCCDKCLKEIIKFGFVCNFNLEQMAKIYPLNRGSSSASEPVTCTLHQVFLLSSGIIYHDATPIASERLSACTLAILSARGSAAQAA